MTEYNYMARHRLRMKDLEAFTATATEALAELRQMTHESEIEILRLHKVIDDLENQCGDWEEKYNDLDELSQCGCIDWKRVTP